MTNEALEIAKKVLDKNNWTGMPPMEGTAIHTLAQAFVQLNQEINMLISSHERNGLTQLKEAVRDAEEVIWALSEVHPKQVQCEDWLSKYSHLVKEGK